MSFINPIPSQNEGVRYLNRIAGLIPYPLRIGGHSKGGNIAVYSAIKCEPSVQNRIINVFNHDGPGFKDRIFESTEFFKIKNRIQKTVPQSSLIGMLLYQQENYSVVDSNRFGAMQHDPFSWVVGNNDFCYAKSVTKGSMYMNKAINKWLSTLTDEKRELFVDTLYQVIGASDAATVYEFSEDWKKRTVVILGAAKNIDAETKKFIFRTIKELAKLSIKTFIVP